MVQVELLETHCSGCSYFEDTPSPPTQLLVRLSPGLASLSDKSGLLFFFSSNGKKFSWKHYNVKNSTIIFFLDKFHSRKVAHINRTWTKAITKIHLITNLHCIHCSLNIAWVYSSITSICSQRYPVLPLKCPLKTCVYIKSSASWIA